MIDPRINVGGRAKLSEAYGDVLASIFPDGGISPEFKFFAEAFAPGRRLTHAEKIALMVAIAAGRGDIAAAREIRAATEGEKLEGLGEVVFRVIYGNGTDDSAPRSG